MNSFFFNPRTFNNQKLPSTIDEFTTMLTKKVIYMARLRLSSSDVKMSQEYSTFKGYYYEILKWIDYIMTITPFSGFDYSHKHQIKDVLKGLISQVANMPYQRLAPFNNK